jgi:formylglycine-generating enzyme required for sulfatase activity
VIGDTRPGVGLREDGLPEMLWISIADGGEITIEYGGSRFGGGDKEKKTQTFEVKSFYISKYLVTYTQYQAFAESDYDNAKWWEGFPEQYRPQQLADARSKMANAPRDSISWYQAVAFSRWLDARLREAKLLPDETMQVRLPTEWEWQWVAQNGTNAWDYPWGDWRESYANTNEAGLSRSTSVGTYPHGKAECGALDMAGNLWEWCANNYNEPEIIDGSNTSYKLLRGGSFSNYQSNARASYRNPSNPLNDSPNYGCRLVVAPILRL